jgi:hypothetical protein
MPTQVLTIVVPDAQQLALSDGGSLPSQPKDAGSLVGSTFNGSQSIAVAGSGTATLTIGPTAALSKQKSGKVLVSASATGAVAAGPGVVTLTILRDATPLLVSNVTVSAAGDFATDFTLLDPDAAPHTYSATLASGAGNITVFPGAQANLVLAIEQ